MKVCHTDKSAERKMYRLIKVFSLHATQFSMLTTYVTAVALSLKAPGLNLSWLKISLFLFTQSNDVKWTKENNCIKVCIPTQISWNTTVLYLQLNVTVIDQVIKRMHLQNKL